MGRSATSLRRTRRGRFDELFAWCEGYYDREIHAVDLTVEAMRGVEDVVAEEDHEWWRAQLTMYRHLNSTHRMSAVDSYYKRKRLRQVAKEEALTDAPS